MADEPTLRDHELDRVEALLRDLDGVELVDPPPDVWSGIEADLGRATASRVVALATRRRRTGLAALAAAAAIVLVVAGVAAFVLRDDDTQVLSTAVLAYDPATFDPAGAGAAATAELVERDGHYEIVLTEASLPSELAGEDLELWLIEANAAGELVDVASVSLVDGPGSYRVPDELDPHTHPIVDISIEPRDGDHEHSGRSILRGSLASA